MFAGIQTWQLAVVAVAAAIVLWPRRAAIVEGVKSLFGSKSGATTDANAIAAAYQLLAPSLNADTAAKLRAELADRLLQPVTQEAKP